jgi:hypothetical protein
MSDFIARYEVQLHEAAKCELRAKRQSWRPHRIVAAGLVGLAVAGVPAVAQNGWFPFAGREDAPTVTHSPRGLGNLPAILSVLRRPQTEGDRQAAQYALKFFGRTFHGVGIDYIRRARVSTGSEAVILVPAKSHQIARGFEMQSGIMCLWRTDYSNGARAGGGRSCFESLQIVGGRALQSLGHRLDMLVPDGVARVDAIAPDGTIRRVKPVDNVASWEGSWPKRIVWYNDRGEPVRSIAG